MPKKTFETKDMISKAENLIRFNPLGAMQDGKHKAVFTGAEPAVRTGTSASGRTFSILEAEFKIGSDTIKAAIDKPVKLVEGDEYEVRKVTNTRGYANAWLS